MSVDAAKHTDARVNEARSVPDLWSFKTAQTRLGRACLMEALVNHRRIPA